MGSFAEGYPFIHHSISFIILLSIPFIPFLFRLGLPFHIFFHSSIPSSFLLPWFHSCPQPLTPSVFLHASLLLRTSGAVDSSSTSAQWRGWTLLSWSPQRFLKPWRREITAASRLRLSQFKGASAVISAGLASTLLVAAAWGRPGWRHPHLLSVPFLRMQTRPWAER